MGWQDAPIVGPKPPGGSKPSWRSAPVVHPRPQGLHAAAAGATGIGPTPWHSQGIFGGRGPSVRDVLSALPAAGGALGGVLGAASGPAAIGGAALGGAAGESFKQLAERAIGVQTPETGTEAAKAIATEGAVQGGAQALGMGLAGTAKAVGRGMVENAVRPPISLQREFPDVIDTIVKERLPVGAFPFAKEKGSERAARRLAEESSAVKELLTKATAGGKSFETSKLAEPVLKLLDEVADQPLSKADMARLDSMLDEFTSKKGPLSPTDVQKLKQKAQAIAKPIYKAVARGEAVSADQAMTARFNASIAEGAKQAMETVPGVAEGEAKKRSLIGAKKALSQAEMRRLPLMAEAGAAVLGGAAGQVVTPMDDPLKRSMAGWLIARGVLSPRTLSRTGLILTRDEAGMILRQFPRVAQVLFSGTASQETQTGSPGSQ